jgi:hypothetical protein
MKDHPSQWNSRGLTCRDVAERVSEYVDGRLLLATKSRIGLHLDSCAHCRTYLKQILLVRDATSFFSKPFPSMINRLHLQQRFAHCRASYAVMN